MRAPATILTIALAAVPLAAAAGADDHPRLVSVETAQCAECHDDLLDGRIAVHAPAADDCTTCHEFSIDDENTTVALMDSEPALCLFCHDDKESAVEMELARPHMPAADSCLTCHDPHAADHEHLLISATAELCSDCHDVAELDQAHGGQLIEATDCATCHEPHGSDNYRMLVASKLHSPFEEGSCQGCHRQPFADRIRLRARGERLCTACHGEFEEPEGGSTHAALTGERGRAGCLSCHDPHMSDEGALLRRRGPQLCATCHEALVASASAEGGHSPAGEDCLTCHEPHSAAEDHLLIEDRTTLCATCHDLQPAAREEPPMVKVEIIGAGRASYGPAPLVVAAGFDNGAPDPALCSRPFPKGTWNGEIVLCERGDVLLVLKGRNVAAGGAGGMVLANRPDGRDDLAEHGHAVPAVHIHAGDRQTVIDWLGANVPAMARIESGKLLLVPPVATGPAAGDLAAVHLGADLRRLDCVACHTPHGEGNPKLLARYLHPPVEDGCDTCHESGHDGLAEGGTSELCLFCHDDPAEGTAVPHDAMELGSCSDCHNAHASAQEKLVKEPGSGPCADCHEEQTAGEGEVAHGAVDLIGCHACHEPHGGQRARLLRGTGPELCLACHAPRGSESPDGAPRSTLLERFTLSASQVAAITPLSLSPDGTRNHPVDGHRVLGTATEQEIARANVQTSFAGELTCLTCHDPHKGKTEKLLQWGASSSFEACQACHAK